MTTRKRKKNEYWREPEEEAIRQFVLSSNEIERHKVYTDTIEPAFRKLIENIYHTYNFGNVLREYMFIEQDLLIYLYERIDKFRLDGPGRGRAFSYFGTVIKNYLIQQSAKAKKFVHINDHNQLITTDASLLDHSKKQQRHETLEFVEHLAVDLPFTDDFNEDDIQVCGIVVEVLKRRHTLDIYNKRQLYMFLREATNLPTRRITKSLKKIQDAYDEIRQLHFDEEE